MQLIKQDMMHWKFNRLYQEEGIKFPHDQYLEFGSIIRGNDSGALILALC